MTFPFVYKLFFAFVGFGSVIARIAVLSETDDFVPVTFFSYFTFQSTLITAAIFLIGAFYIFAKKKSPTFTALRGAALLYTLITGIIFSLLLANFDGAFTLENADSIIMHYIIPLAVLADWVIDKPAHKLTWSTALSWLVYPLGYVIYSLVRGALIGWYPYSFLNPGLHGYHQVVMTIIILFISVVLVALGIILSTRRSFT